MTSSAPFSITQRVYSEDIDLYNVVYHSNYLKYFERARTEWLLDQKMSMTTFLQENCAFVVRKMDIDFLRPLTLHQDFIVDCDPYKHSRSTVTFKQTIQNLERTDTYCQAEVLLVTINKEGKVIKIPESIKEILECQ